MKELTLTLLFLIKDDQILLAMKKRGFGAGRFNGVGGKLETDESIEQALIREAQEEINVTPIKFNKVADITFDEYYKNEQTLMRVHVFTSDEWEGQPTESEEMVPQWFNVDNVPYSDMWPDDPYWLPQVLNGSKVTAHFKLDKNDVILEHNVDLVKA